MKTNNFNKEEDNKKSCKNYTYQFSVYLCRCLPPSIQHSRNPPSVLARILTTSSLLKQTWPITTATSEP